MYRKVLWGIYRRYPKLMDINLSLALKWYAFLDKYHPTIAPFLDMKAHDLHNLINFHKVYIECFMHEAKNGLTDDLDIRTSVNAIFRMVKEKNDTVSTGDR